VTNTLSYISTDRTELSPTGVESGLGGLNRSRVGAVYNRTLGVSPSHTHGVAFANL